MAKRRRTSTPPAPRAGQAPIIPPAGPPIDPATKTRMKDKAKLIKDAVLAQFPGSGFSVSTRHGTVMIERIVQKTDAEGVDFIEVYLLGSTASGDPHFRIYNPPSLVEDPTGPVEAGGRRYRQDPVQALAEVLALHGGRSTAKQQRPL